MSTTIELAAKDGHRFAVYRADPPEKPAPAEKKKGAIVVIQEIFGVNPHIRRVAGRYAAAGYTALAPALFDRVRPGVELGYDKEGVAEGLALRAQIPLDSVLADLQATIDAAAKLDAVRSGGGKVGVVGYCWGGSLSYLAAARLSGLSAAVGYYGALIAANASEKPRVPTILHFGETDQSIPPGDIEKIRAARPEIPVFVYKGAGHGFNCDERDSFDPDAAALALQRSLRFFEEHLG